MNQKNPNFSFVILTHNDEMHLPRLLSSINGLNARICVLDSGSTDRTLDICRAKGVEVAHAPFVNHPQQWDTALHMFHVLTPWTIALDADQALSPELYRLLLKFVSNDHDDIEGIYFNRKNIYKNKWIKHGGYYPMYLLKMFRTDSGYSDLSQTVDHRFQVPYKTIIWKTGYLIEENLKDNNISFWIEKHNRYSDLLAEEAVNYPKTKAYVTMNHGLFGSPNRRKAWKNQIWEQLPLYLRPCLYLIYRLFIQRGILDGKTGILFHFLQAFWFRLIVDIKIEELRAAKRVADPERSDNSPQFLNRAALLFILFYCFNLLFIGLSTPGGLYIPFLANEINYINAFRNFYIFSTTQLLEGLGFEVAAHTYGLKVAGHAGFNMVYSCLGYLLISSFAALALALPNPLKRRYLFLGLGIAGIIALNIVRLALIAIYYRADFQILFMDHHLLFNLFIYASILLYTYLWLKVSYRW